jgi:hypothetical protein
MTRERAISLMLATADPLPPETHPDWTALVEMLEKDPQLDAWFTQMTPADTALQKAMSELHTEVKTPEVIKRSELLTSRRVWLQRAAAAALVAGGGGAAWLTRPVAYEHLGTSVSYEDFCSDMCVYAARLLKLEHKGSSIAQLQQWMTEKTAPTPLGRMPPAVAARMAKGCKRVPWGSREVGLICFSKEDGRIVHIFSLPAQQLAAQPSAEALRRAQNFGGREVVGWVAEGVVNILVSAKPGTSTAELLSTV